MKYDWSAITPPSSESITIEPFAVSFDLPSRWHAGRQQGDLVVLGSHSDAGMIVAHAGLYEGFDSFFGALSRFFAGLGVAARATDGPRQKYLGSYDGIVAAYSGTDSEGNALFAYVRGVLARGGIGAGAFGISAPAAAAEITDRIESIARSFYFGAFKPDVTLGEQLVGKWRRNTVGAVRTSTYEFSADGTYRLYSDRLEDSGRFCVASGKMILASTRAGSSAFDLRFHGRLLEIGESEYIREG